MEVSLKHSFYPVIDYKQMGQTQRPFKSFAMEPICYVSNVMISSEISPDFLVTGLITPKTYSFYKLLFTVRDLSAI